MNPTTRAGFSLFLIGVISSGCSSGKAARPGEVYNAGLFVVDGEAQLRHTFRVRNTTGRPVVIRETEKSCACTTAKLSKTSLEIGEEAELELTSSLPRSLSDSALSCTLVTDHADFARWEYFIRYRTVPPVLASPKMVDLGTIHQGDVGEDGRPKSELQSAPMTVEVFGRDPAALADVTIQAPSGVVVAPVDRGVDEQAIGDIRHRRFRFSVSLDPRSILKRGRSRETATFRAAGSAAEVPITWRFAPAVEASPPAISFGIVHAHDESPTRRVLIRSASGKAIRVLAVTSGAKDAGRIEWVNAGEPGGPAASRVIELRLVTGKKGGDEALAGEAEILTDDPHQPRVTIPWSALIRADRRAVDPARRVDATTHRGEQSP